MVASNLGQADHPHDALGAYALDALDDDETALVEEHLNWCAGCGHLLAELQSSATLLGQSVPTREPPANLRARLIGAVTLTAPTSSFEPSREAFAPPRLQIFRVLAPVAAVVVIALFTLSVVMNIRISDRVGNLSKEMGSLEQQNSMLTAQLQESAQQDTEVAQSMEGLQLASYWLANPDNHPMVLRPPGGSGESQGVMLVGSDGQKAVLMVVGMRELPPPQTYHVWLMRQGNRTWAARLSVDAKGWGATTLTRDDSMYGFDKVELTAGTPEATPRPSDMVLEGRIPIARPSPMLVTRP